MDSERRSRGGANGKEPLRASRNHLSRVSEKLDDWLLLLEDTSGCSFKGNKNSRSREEEEEEEEEEEGRIEAAELEIKEEEVEEEERFPELSLSYSSIIFSRSSSEVTEMRASRSSPGSWYLMRSKEGEGGEGEGEGEETKKN